MKPIKMFGLAALAALLAMAFAGASSAMAEETALCTADESPCQIQNLVTHVHETTSVKSRLLSENEIECNVLFLGDTVGVEATPAVVSGKFTYSSCTNSCTVAEANGPAEIKILRSGTELAAITGEGLVNVKCFFGIINCSYNGEGLEGHALGPLNGGGTNGTITIEGQETHKEVGSEACPPEALLDLETHPLSPVYIKAPPAMVCIYVGTNNGFYLGKGSGGNCASKDGTRVGEYELARAGITELNKHVCAFVGTNNGFYLLRSSNTLCANSDAPNRLGAFELGETVG